MLNYKRTMAFPLIASVLPTYQSLSSSFFFFYKFIFCFVRPSLLFVGYSLVAVYSVAVCRLLIVVASLLEEHGLQSMQASVVVARGLSSCGSWALERRLSSCGSRVQLLHGMWDLPGPGLEPLSPALAVEFLTTAPPGKSNLFLVAQN